jgi:adenosylcobinamide kinase/adenosylcobinamide-phosphate guanylyltransferase
VASAFVGEDEDLKQRIQVHKDRRPGGWGTLEAGDLGEVLKAAEQWNAVLFDSLTLWVSARGEDEALAEFESFLRATEDLVVPFVLVSDEVGLGVVPGFEEGRRFRDALGLINQGAAAAAEEVHLCVAGVGVRIK